MIQLLIVAALLAGLEPAPAVGAANTSKEAGADLLSSFLENPGRFDIEKLQDLDIETIAKQLAQSLPYTHQPAPAVEGKVKLGDDYYLYRLPESYDPSRSWPLMISLHGNPKRHCERVHEKYWGGDATAGGLILVSPNLEGGRWKRREGEVMLFKTLKDAVTRFRVDLERIYLNGYSAGGSGAWSHGVAYADLFAGIVVRCGIRRPEDDEMRNLKGLGVFVIHAQQDKACPVENARSAVKVLERIHVDHRYVEYPGGHDFFPMANEEVLAYVGEFRNPRNSTGFAYKGSFRHEERILRFLSMKGATHQVQASREGTSVVINISDLEKVESLDFHVSLDEVRAGVTLSVTVNGVEKTVVPKGSARDFARSWRLLPYFDADRPGLLFVGIVRLVEGGVVL